MRWKTPFVLVLALVIGLPLASAAEPLRLATFNIHHAEGTDGKLDLDRVAEVVRGSDIIGFQEVDVKFGRRSQFADQAAELARKLGGKEVFGGNLINGEGKYGVALVSKHPILESQNHPLPFSAGREKAEPRGVLEVRLDVPGGPLRVLVTHLAHDSNADRLLQVEALVKLVKKSKERCVLMGDLNFNPANEAYRRLIEGGNAKVPLLVDAWERVGKGEGSTIGVRGRRGSRIDYILVTPDLAKGLRTIRVESETNASDHQPVLATLEIE